MRLGLTEIYLVSPTRVGNPTGGPGGSFNEQDASSAAVAIGGAACSRQKQKKKSERSRGSSLTLFAVSCTYAHLLCAQFTRVLSYLRSPEDSSSETTPDSLTTGSQDDTQKRRFGTRMGAADAFHERDRDLTQSCGEYLCELAEFFHDVPRAPLSLQPQNLEEHLTGFAFFF